MLLEGHGRQLYDAELQRQYQARYAGRIGTLYIHPPFETIVYLTVAWLPLKQAYLLWCLLNFGFLALAAWTAGREGFLPFDWRLLLLASLTFVPVLLCFMQGQDSLLLLLLETLAFAALRRKRAWAAGCWLGFGLFKFQLVLPMAMVFAMRRSRSRFLQGFVLVALALAGLCAVVSGWSVFAAYPSFLLTLQGQRFAGVVPQAMANFRGLTVLILGNRSPFTVSVIALLSVAALLATVFAWPETGPVSDQGQSHAHAGQGQCDPGFATASLFALLVSYHLNPHDLSLLLLPMALLLGDGTGVPKTRMTAERWLILGCCVTLFLPPLHLWALQAHAYALLSVPLTALFAVCVHRARNAGERFN